ncbi:NapC/NirT family cytochrome c [Rodentibacter caecimuris]|uniref:Cytochrome c-type protein n=1 Tax=Rodentibacter caecimuris TaxID=1796644 RepID=A0ABX3KXF8_9PAST|nr:cytochrome C [Rodentibacter heylii]
MSEKKPNIIIRFWRWFRTPSRMAVGTLIILSALGGIFAWSGFNAAVNTTNTEAFCSSCHTNDAYAEYLHSAHYQTRTGVGASCPDCHLPHEFIPKWTRKIQAAREVYAYVMGYTDTLEKYNERRLHMAQREWERMKANDSQECRNCHNVDRMNFNEQRDVAAKMHAKIKSEGKTCIDCHKGIAHQLPDMREVESGFKSKK